jgi:hypothetical protein
MGKPIAFRLEGETDGVFRQKAEARGLNANALAQELAIESLAEGGQVQQLRERILTLESSVDELRRDIGVCARLVLVGTKTMSEGEAKEWVKSNLLS